ncbi:hypothetical protein ES703_103809 [subsurface metagenome]
MKVLLFDADLKMPNLALMKLSAYYKAMGYDVELNFPMGEYDEVFASCVFTKNRHLVETLPFKVIGGGTGWDIHASLQPDIEHLMPDYDLYNCNYSVGFTSRGCIRRCPWCIVPQKEGDIQDWAEIYEFWDRRHRKIVLLDNNLLAAPNWKSTLRDLARERVMVDFNQGLDIRLVDDEVAWSLKQTQLTRWLRFAFDEPSMEQQVREGIRILEQAGIPPSRLWFYMLIGFDTTFEQDVERLGVLEGLGCEVFAMGYQEVNGVKPRLPWGGPGTLQEFGRWINVKQLHRHMTYKEWLRMRKAENR